MERPEPGPSACYDDHEETTRVALYARAPDPPAVLASLRRSVDGRPGQHAIVSEFFDAQPVADFANRRGVHRLLAGVAREEVDLVVVERVEHLVDHYSTLAHIMRLLDAHEVALVALAQGIDTTRPESRELFAAFVTIAEIEALADTETVEKEVR